MFFVIKTNCLHFKCVNLFQAHDRYSFWLLHVHWDFFTSNQRLLQFLHIKKLVFKSKLQEFWLFKIGDMARLVSPVQAKNDGKCLYFWYHAYGAGKSSTYLLIIPVWLFFFIHVNNSFLCRCCHFERIFWKASKRDEQSTHENLVDWSQSRQRLVHRQNTDRLRHWLQNHFRRW